jgi:NitT/TauT family transport system substrate-binding protein
MLATKIGRRSFLGAASALALSPGAGLAQNASKIRIAGSASGDIVVALWAQQSGIFARYGIDADIERMNSGAAVVSAVVGGSLEIGKGSLYNLIIARSKGIPLVLEAAAATYDASDPDAALVVAKDSPLRNARDLAGKTLAVASLGDFYTVMNQAWLDANGGDSTKTKFLELPGLATVDAVVSGRVDAATIADPLLSAAVKSGKCRILAYPENVAGNFSIATAYFCDAAYAGANAPVLARFRKAMDESSAYVNAHHADAIPLVSKFSGVDPANVIIQSKLGNSSHLRDPRLIQPTIDMAAKYKAIPKSYAARDIIDPNALIVS